MLLRARGGDLRDECAIVALRLIELLRSCCLFGVQPARALICALRYRPLCLENPYLRGSDVLAGPGCRLLRLDLSLLQRQLARVDHRDYSAA